MSAPGIQMQQAESLELGFLAARAAEAIQRKLNGEPLRSTDTEALQNAHQFLTDVIQGASLVSGAEFAGHSAQVVSALRYATHPVSSLQAAISSNEEFSNFFAQLADAIIAPDVQEDTLSSAHRFFELLVGSLRNAMSRTKSPSVGSIDRSISELQQIG